MRFDHRSVILFACLVVAITFLSYFCALITSGLLVLGNFTIYGLYNQ